jgi:hypothetical protein
MLRKMRRNGRPPPCHIRKNGKPATKLTFYEFIKREETGIMIRERKIRFTSTMLCYSLAVLLLLGGCSGKNIFSSDESLDESAVENVPYRADDFSDIMVPPELSWDREGSMAIKTESYAGGVMRFTGRVEVNSLADFFVNTMQRNNWKMVGSAKYKNVLLAFTKPNKTALVMIMGSDLGGKTSVQIYLTDDISARQGSSSYNQGMGR